MNAIIKPDPVLYPPTNTYLGLCSGYGQFHTDKDRTDSKGIFRKGKSYIKLTFNDVLRMVENPPSVAKESAQWVIFSDLLTRESEKQRESGKYYAAWCDFDNHTDLEAIKTVLAKLGCFYIVYSSRSATVDKQKYRVIIPFSQLANPTEWQQITAIINDKFEVAGIIPDRVSERFNQVCYLPNKGDFYQFHIEYKHDPLDWKTALAAELTDKQNQAKAEKERIEQLREQSRLKAIERMATGSLSPIDAYNAAYPIEQCLELYGYKRIGKKYLSPNSESGAAGITIKDNKWFSSHSSDAGIGTPNKNGGCSGDAFDLFAWYEHSGNRNAAIKAAGVMFTTPSGKTITKANQAAYSEQHKQNTVSHSGVKNTADPQANSLNRKEKRALVSIAKKEGVVINFDIALDAKDYPDAKHNGQLRATLRNLKHFAQGYGIKFKYDVITKEPSIIFGNAFDNAHGDLLANSNLANLSSLFELNALPSERMLKLLPAVFSSNATNPILNFIQSRQWDKTDRIIDLFKTLTVSDNDQEYAYLALKTWLIQCVAAADGARQSGNKNAIPKYELVFILQGAQGFKKTSWFLALLPKELKHYIRDGVHLDPNNKDSIKQAISCWICELGELDSTFKRSDISQLKAFLSKLTDIIRLPYDRVASNLGRRTSFCGSVNPETFLVDNTGNRRYLPVQVTACDSLHTIDMQQLWAQVWQLYLDGAQWWCSKELESMLEERHERHAEINPVHEMIAECFDIEKVTKSFDSKHYTATKILAECGIKEPKTSQAKIINEYLKSRGFSSVQCNGVRGFWLEKRPLSPN
jgi:predicted P-loop ATPase